MSTSTLCTHNQKIMGTINEDIKECEMNKDTGKIEINMKDGLILTYNRLQCRSFAKNIKHMDDLNKKKNRF